jgi:hypothetical protein
LPTVLRTNLHRHGQGLALFGHCFEGRRAQHPPRHAQAEEAHRQHHWSIGGYTMFLDSRAAHFVFGVCF